VRELWNDSVWTVALTVPKVPVTIREPIAVLQAAPLREGYKLRYAYFRPGAVSSRNSVANPV
jgi:hypothetical protein